MKPARWVYFSLVSFIAAFLFLDWALDQEHQGLTFSEGTRETFSDLPQGRLVWSLVWGGFTAWFWWHIEHKMARKWWK